MYNNARRCSDSYAAKYRGKSHGIDFGSQNPRPRSVRPMVVSLAVIPGCAQTFSKAAHVCPGHRAEFPQPWQRPLCLGRRWESVHRLYQWARALILGHAYGPVNDAVYEQMQLGVSFSLPHTIEVEVAETCCASLSPARKWCDSGRTAPTPPPGAVRLVGARSRDATSCSAAAITDGKIGTSEPRCAIWACREAVRELTIPFPYNDLDALRALIREPCRQSCVRHHGARLVSCAPAKDYLKAVKETLPRERRAADL